MDQPLKAHLFICTNQRDSSRASCGPAGGCTIRDELKRRLKERGLGQEARVNQSGCLGRCEEGPVAVLYPEGRWFLRIGATGSETLEDIESAIDAALSRSDSIPS